MDIKNVDVWNTIIKFIEQTKNEDLKKEAKMLLNDYNTAGGIRIRQELLRFIQKNNLRKN